MRELTRMQVPLPRPYTKRRTKRWDELQPGDSVIIDEEGSSALRSFIERRGWTAVQQKQPDGKVQIWRQA